MLKSVYLTLFFVTVLVSSKAQNEFYKLTPLPLNDLSAFKTPSKNWKITGPVSGSYDNTVSKADKGSGILFNDFDPKARFNADANLFTQLEHGDIFLALDFMTPKGSNSGIYLQGRYEIQLFDSWGIKVPHVTDCGSIYERWDEKRPEGKKGYEGHPARTNASLAPNLWQHLEIEFRAPRYSQGKKISPAQFVKVKLNGIVIHENVILSGPTRAAAFDDEKAVGPLMIQGDHGPVVFRNIQYALLDEFNVKFKTLDYEYYEGNFNEFTKVEASHLVRKGKAEAIDIKLADNPNKLCLVFTGKIDLKENSEYQFIIKKIGKAKLSIDGEEVVRTRDLFQDYTVSKNLNAGEHTIVFSYLKDFSWAPTGMGLYIGKLNSRPQALHTASSLPPLPPTPLINVIPAQQPEIIRSFMEHLGKKKTHAISVGDPSAMHYAYDLNQAGLMQVWKGDFLNTTDMWYERGEPQVATSMGAAIILNGKPPVAMVTDNKVALPDSLNETDLFYKGYTLNAQRAPTFTYSYKEVSFEDSFAPLNNGQGLLRSISIPKMPSNSTLFIRMGEGSVITEVAENVFAIDDQRYYIQFQPVGKLKPQIRSAGNRKELVVEVKTPFPAVIKYNLLW